VLAENSHAADPLEAYDDVTRQWITLVKDSRLHDCCQMTTGRYGSVLHSPILADDYLPPMWGGAPLKLLTYAPGLTYNQLLHSPNYCRRGVTAFHAEPVTHNTLEVSRRWH
jgi:hypothetical protein